MKKKVFSILLAVAMLASLTVWCGGKEEPADVPETTEEIVETKDALRSEVYANLFSYGIGENNGDKDAFISNFANSWE